MKAYKIHLIRHAMTEENLDGKYIGQTDVPASEYGLRQIKDIIDEYGGYPEVDAVVSSPLKRCTETAKLIYPDKEPMILNGLIEYDFGEFEGRTADEMKDDDAFKTWLSGEHPETPVPFGLQRESLLMLCRAYRRNYKSRRRIDRGNNPRRSYYVAYDCICHTVAAHARVDGTERHGIYPQDRPVRVEPRSEARNLFGMPGRGTFRRPGA